MPGFKSEVIEGSLCLCKPHLYSNTQVSKPIFMGAGEVVKCCFDGESVKTERLEFV